MGLAVVGADPPGLTDAAGRNHIGFSVLIYATVVVVVVLGSIRELGKV